MTSRISARPITLEGQIWHAVLLERLDAAGEWVPDAEKHVAVRPRAGESAADALQRAVLLFAESFPLVVAAHEATDCPPS